MKIRHGIIISLALFIALVILGYGYLPLDINTELILKNIIAILWITSLGLIAYLIIRTIFRTIKGAITGAPKKAKQVQDNLPWEE